MSDFLKESISDWIKFGRSVALVFLFSIILIIVFSSSIIIAKNVFTRVEITIDNGIPIVRSKRETLRVVVVPSQQVGVASGIKLSKDKVIKITTQGLISTGNFLPDLLKNSETMSDIEQAILYLEKNRDLNIGWRQPDGERIYGKEVIDPTYKTEECENLSKKHRFLDANWGCLLGFIKKDGENLASALERSKNNGLIFEIGKDSKIEYNNSGFNVIGTMCNNEKYNPEIPKKYEDSELIFLVNDTRADENYINELKKCQESFESPFEKARNEMVINLYNKIKEKMNDDFIGLYYLDNQGSFIVSILEEPKS